MTMTPIVPESVVLSVANEVGRLSRRPGAPVLDASADVPTLVRWLEWCDPNGEYRINENTGEPLIWDRWEVVDLIRDAVDDDCWPHAPIWDPTDLLPYQVYQVETVMLPRGQWPDDLDRVAEVTLRQFYREPWAETVRSAVSRMAVGETEVVEAHNARL